MNDQINNSRKEFDKLGTFYNNVWMLGDIHSEASKKAIREIKEFVSGK